MTLIEAFKKVFIEEIFTVQGRASRKEYWGSELIAFPLIFVVDSIAYFISLSLGDLIYGLTYLWAFIAYTTCSIRRMHDVNRSGWYVLIPIYNLILSINPSDQNKGSLADKFCIRLASLSRDATNQYGGRIALLPRHPIPSLNARHRELPGAAAQN